MSDKPAKIGIFPGGGPSREIASRGEYMKVRLADAIRGLVGWIAQRAHLPGVVQPIELDDEASGNTLRITVSERFTRITVNGRDFYFRRISGRFDGTGSGTLGRQQ